MSTPTGTTDPAPSPPPPPGGGRGVRGTAADMIRTLLVVLGVVAVIVVLVPRPGRITPPAVDVLGSAQGAAATGLGFTPLVPQGLPAGWTPTAAEARTGTDGAKVFHIGYVTPQQFYAGVEQATQVSDEWLNVNDAGGTPVGQVTIDGVAWQQFDKPDRSYTSLLVRRPGRVVLVTSKGGGLAEATVLARALHVPAS